jgi:hypothetical protein
MDMKSISPRRATKHKMEHQYTILLQDCTRNPKLKERKKGRKNTMMKDRGGRREKKERRRKKKRKEKRKYRNLGQRLELGYLGYIRLIIRELAEEVRNLAV